MTEQTIRALLKLTLNMTSVGNTYETGPFQPTDNALPQLLGPVPLGILVLALIGR